MTTDGMGMLVNHERHETHEIGGNVIGSASTSTSTSNAALRTTMNARWGDEREQSACPEHASAPLQDRAALFDQWHRTAGGIGPVSGWVNTQVLKDGRGKVPRA